MECQVIECKKKAIWREVDHYAQQKQAYTFFYYLCGEHKKKVEAILTTGHTKEFYRLAS